LQEALKKEALTAETLARLQVIIPALNEEGSISNVINSLIAEGISSSQITVVDGGSTDKTAEMIESAGANLLVEQRRGYGRACLKALAELRPKMEASSIVLFVDADGSDDISDLKKILQVMEAKQADLVIGSRLVLEESKKSVPPVSRLGNAFACWVIARLYGVQFSDLGPFRAIRWSALESLQMSDEDWGWTVEMQIKAARQGLQCEEVAVAYRQRESGESKISGSLIGGLKAGYKILFILGKYTMKR